MRYLCHLCFPFLCYMSLTRRRFFVGGGAGGVEGGFGFSDIPNLYFFCILGLFHSHVLYTAVCLMSMAFYCCFLMPLTNFCHYVYRVEGEDTMSLYAFNQMLQAQCPTCPIRIQCARQGTKRDGGRSGEHP